MNAADLRKGGCSRGLAESGADIDPLKQFERWFQDALAADLPLPNAMTLATAGEDGRADARIVLLKGLECDGFVFFTNYQSRKGKLARDPHAPARCSSGLNRTPGPHRKSCRGNVVSAESGNLLRHPPARRPSFGMGLGAERPG